MNPEVLFKPFNHPKLLLDNRIVMLPMTRQFSPNGISDKNVENYHRRRALLANADWPNKVKNDEMGFLETFRKEQLAELI